MWRYRSKYDTPGSTMAWHRPASTERMRFMRFRSTTTLPDRIGAEPPYPKFLPVEIG